MSYYLCTVCHRNQMWDDGERISCEECNSAARKNKGGIVTVSTDYTKCTVCRQKWVYLGVVCIDCIDIGRAIH